MTLAPWTLCALGFSLAALAGTLIAQRLYAGCVPFEDGPRSVAVAQWPFALGAAVFGWLTAAHTADARVLALTALVALALAACAFSDLRFGLVPDAITLPALGIVTTLAGLRHDAAPVFGALMIGVPFMLLALVSRGRGMGWGDVKLALLGGALLGAGQAALALSAACVTTSAIALAAGRRSAPAPLGATVAAAIAFTLALHPLG